MAPPKKQDAEWTEYERLRECFIAGFRLAKENRYDNRPEHYWMKYVMSLKNKEKQGVSNNLRRRNKHPLPAEL